MITVILQILGLFVLVLPVFVWITKKLAGQLLARDLEQYRSRLESSRIEFEAGLKALAFEHQTKFSLLHKERAEKTLEIWRTLKSTGSKVERFVHPMQSGGPEEQDKSGEIAEAKIRELNLLIYDNTIYFPKSIADRLVKYADELRKLFYRAYMDYTMARKKKVNPYFGHSGQESSDFGESWSKLNKDIVPLVNELEQICRQLLGVEDDVADEKIDDSQ